MSDAGWEVAARTPDVLLSHRSCPWGGHLIKVESKNIFLQNAPTDSRDFFARPEVEAKFHCDECTMKCMDINAPGDALIERTNTMWIIRFASVLFGDCMGHSLQQRFFFNKMPVVSRHCLYKDFPQPGSSAYYENAGAQSLLCGRCIQRSQGHLGAMGLTIHSRFCHHVAKSSRESIQHPALSGHTCRVCKNVHDPVHEELHARTPHDSTERAERALRLFRRLGHSFNGVAAWFDVMDTVQCWQEILPQRIPAVLHGTPRAQDEDL